MHKLIKKYQTGGQNSFAQDKAANYPNTQNAGGSNLQDLYKVYMESQGWRPVVKDTEFGGGFIEDPQKSGKNFFSNIFKGMGGTSGLVSLATNIGESLLPKRITSKGTDVVNGILGAASNIPGPVGLYANAAKFTFNAIDSLGASKLATLNSNQDTEDTLARTGGGYGDFMDNWDEAKTLSGKRAGLFTSKSSLNNKIYDANRKMSVLQQIMDAQKTNELLTAQMGDRWNERTMRDLNGGYGNISFGRHGFKIEILNRVHSILNTPKVIDILTELEDEVPEFKDGGKMNVIPEGSLHARLHHMENAEGLTKKGIPVVSEREGGELEQQAEIELNEIIFTLEVTQQLEKLMEDGSDNAAIEAGKLLVKEIFENTDDRTGLLKQLEPEKKVQTPEEIVAQHQVFQQGGVINSDKSIEQLVDYAIQVNPLFVQRIGPNMGYAEFDDEKGQRRKGTHLLGYTEKDDKYLVFPQIQMKEGRLQYIPDWKEAFNTASKQNNVISFDNEKDALTFTEKYKDSKQWKQYFDIWKQRYD